MEDNGYALFVDNSGSVGGTDSYWKAVSDILARYAKDISRYYLWNSTCSQTTLKELERNMAQKIGTGGTSPEYVAQAIVDKRISRIILVTDGQVGDGSVKRCDQIFQLALQKKFKISKSICFIITTWKGRLNMSVTCPFTRYCESQVFTKQGNEEVKSVLQYTANDYKILDQLQEITLKNFQQKYDLIEGLIIALNMGKSGNIPLKNQLVILKGRLLKELSGLLGKEGYYSQEIRFHLEKGNFEAAIEIADVMTKKYFEETMTTELQKKISHLINLCGDLQGKYNIGQIKSNRLAIANIAKEAKIDEGIDIRKLSNNIIECPIIFDDDVPQILVDECPPFFLGVEKKIVDDIANCPLRILNYPEIKAKFKASLSTFTGAKITSKLLKNPFTQNRLLGTIPLGNHISHVEVGNYTLAKLIAGGKILGNLNLYFAVIWCLIDQGQIEYLKPIRVNVTEHLMYRLRNSRTTASLCGLGQFVNTDLSTDVAIWYCVNSGYLNQPADRDTFRFHCFNMEPMISILEALKYPVHDGVKQHLQRTKILIKLLSKFKKMDTHQKHAFKALFRGLYQNGIFLRPEQLVVLDAHFKELEVVTTFIPIDGVPENQQAEKILDILPKYCRQITFDQLYYISKLLDSQKLASDIFLDYRIKAPPLPKPEINWCYGLEDHDVSKLRYNPRTLRPYYMVHDTTWEQCAKQTFKVQSISQLFKGSRYLEDFVQKYKKLPSHVELLLFYYNRYVEADKKATLPYLIQPWTHHLIEIFSEACQGQDMDSIVQILASSATAARRVYMQEF